MLWALALSALLALVRKRPQFGLGFMIFVKCLHNMGEDEPQSESGADLGRALGKTARRWTAACLSRTTPAAAGAGKRTLLRSSFRRRPAGAQATLMGTCIKLVYVLRERESARVHCSPLAAPPMAGPATTGHTQPQIATTMLVSSCRACSRWPCHIVEQR
jgi:hypothetical protein